MKNNKKVKINFLVIDGALDRICFFSHFNSKSYKIKNRINQGYRSLTRFDHKINCKKYLKIVSNYL